LPLIVFADNITDEYIDNLTAILYTKHYIPKEFSVKVLTSLKVDNETLYKISNPKRQFPGTSINLFSLQKTASPWQRNF